MEKIDRLTLELALAILLSGIAAGAGLWQGHGVLSGGNVDRDVFAEVLKGTDRPD